MADVADRYGRVPPYLVVSLLIVLVLLGGGGSPASLAELATELAAAAALIVFVLVQPGTDFRELRAVSAIIVLLIAVPAVQLLPLPPVLWQALPGREGMTAALGLIGADDTWRAMSIAPHRTLASLLSLGPPLLMLWLTAQANRRTQYLLVGAICGLAVLSVIVGAAQLAQGEIGASGWLDFYDTNDTGTLHGFQANRNTQADVLLIGMVALAVLWTGLTAARRKALAPAGLAVTAVLLLGLFLTGSRTGIALASLALGFALAIVQIRTAGRPRLEALRNSTTVLSLVAVLPLIAGAIVYWLRAAPPIARVLARFDFSGEFRPELWRDSWFAAGQYWPLGSGLGTFIPAFLPAERLEVVDATLPNRAHNELLELAIEGGLPLLACWLAAAAILLWHLRRGLAVADLPARRNALFASAVLVMAGLHSLVDYPLRSVAMASLVAVAAGIILSLDNKSLHPGWGTTEMSR